MCPSQSDDLKPINEERADEEHAVLVHITPDRTVSRWEDWSISELSEELEEAIQRAGVGTYDGDEVGEDQLIVYTYGPDADRLAEVVLESLKDFRMGPGSYLVKRYGEPGRREERLELQ